MESARCNIKGARPQKSARLTAAALLVATEEASAGGVGGDGIGALVTGWELVTVAIVVPGSWLYCNGFVRMIEPKLAMVLSSSLAVPAAIFTAWPTLKPLVLATGRLVLPDVTACVIVVET
jgi:hypothetical protein